MIGEAIRSGVGLFTLLSTAFFVSLPLWGSTFVWCLKTVLVALNNFGG